MEGQSRLENESEGEATPVENAVEEHERRPSEVEKTRVKQCRGMSSGVYIKGVVEDVPILFTADTGASRTVISSRVFNKIAQKKQPKLLETACLIGASGLPIQELGKGHFAIQLGSHEKSIDAIVADIEDEALLGFDVLNGSDQGAADILLSQNKIILDGVEIPCFQVGRDDTAKRVIMADNVEVPGRTEAFVDVHVDRNEGGDYDPKVKCFIEPVKKFAGKLGDYLQNLKDKMLLAHEMARRHLGSNAKRNKEIYDAKMSFTGYNVGDLVWCLHETRKVGVSPKLEKAYDGPYVVKVKLSKINFALQLDSTGTERIVHHNKLKLYEGTNPPRWTEQLATKLKSRDRDRK